jgi:serine/threonine protein kinase/WD40 repeat protein/Leucine-rich repeat (LRR) protein
MDQAEKHKRASVIIAECMRRKDAGKPVDPDKVRADHPEVSDELREYFDGEQMLGKLLGDSGGAGGKKKRKPASQRETQGPAAGDSVPSAGNSFAKLPVEFGRYRVQKVLGQGAMGAVYLAHDTKLARDVALKTPKLDVLEGGELVERFEREARAAATLHHRNICPVFDVGEIDGVRFLTMAYIEGRPLSEFVSQDKPMSRKQAATVVRKLALGLQEAHDHGVVHRDLKPANVMIDKSREPVVMDFGLAHQVENTDKSRLTGVGVIMGSPAYMSPEQVDSNPDAVGHATDIYSLGVILFELLTGRLPYEGSVVAIIGQIVSADTPDVRGLRSNVDEGLAAICLKMMAKSTANRYATMNDVAVALTGYLRAYKRQTPVPTGQQSIVSSDLVFDEDAVNQSTRTFAEPKTRAALQKSNRRTKQQAKWVAGGLLGLLLLATVIIRFKDGTTVEIPDGKSVTFETNPDGSLKSFEVISDTTRSAEPRPAISRAASNAAGAADDFLGDPDRRAAKRIFERGGSVRLFSATNQHKRSPKIRKMDDLPEGPLSIVNVSFFRVEGPIDPDLPLIAHMSDLKGLDLDRTDTTDVGIASLRNLTSLEVLWLRRTKVTDESMRHLSKLSRLHFLDLTGTSVTDAGLVPLKGLAALKTLSLDSLSITSEGLKTITANSNLVSLDLGGTSINDDDLAPIAELTNLQILQLAKTRVRGPGLIHLKRLPKLTRLYLDRTNLESSAVAALADLGQMQVLSLSNTPLADNELKLLSQLQHLQYLNITGTNVTDAELTSLVGVRSLRSLYLGGTSVTDDGLQTVGEMNQLVRLSLADTSITDDGIAQLTGLRQLSWIDLSNTRVTDACVKHLNQLPALRNLFLSQTQLSAEGIAELKNAFPNCVLRTEAPPESTDGLPVADTPEGFDQLRTPDGRIIIPALPVEVLPASDPNAAAVAEATALGQSMRVFEEPPGLAGEYDKRNNYAVAFGPDGGIVDTANPAGTMRIRNVVTGDVATSPTDRQGIEAVAWSADRSQMVLGLIDGKIEVWQDGQNQPTHSFQMARPHGIRRVAFSPDSSRVVACGDLRGGTIRRLVESWSLVDGSSLGRIDIESGGRRKPTRVFGVDVSPDLSLAAIAVGHGVQIWNLETHELRQTIVTQNIANFRDLVQTVVFSNDGKRLAVGGYANFSIVDAATGNVLHTLATPRDKIDAVAFSPDGRRVVSCSSFVHKSVQNGINENEDRTRFIEWDLATGKNIREWQYPGSATPRHLVFSADGSYLAAAGLRFPLRVWEMEKDGPIK